MRKPPEGGPTDPAGPLRRIPRAPIGMRTDGTRVVVRGSPAIRWMFGILCGVALIGDPRDIDTFGAVALIVIASGLLLANRLARAEFHRDGWVLAAGRGGLRWVATRPDARIYFFDQFTGKGTFAAVGIVGQGTTHDVGGVSFTKVARTDRLGPLANMWGAARAIRTLATVDRAGCWPDGCWVDLSGAGPIVDPRGRTSRRHLRQAGLTRPPDTSARWRPEIT
jgi:hypothetical protein